MHSNRVNEGFSWSVNKVRKFHDRLAYGVRVQIDLNSMDTTSILVTHEQVELFLSLNFQIKFWDANVGSG